MNTPFASLATLQQEFAEGLAGMLASHRNLGVYILVLANAAYDDTLWPRLAPVLARRHAELAGAITGALRHGTALTEPDDDLMVFLKLHMIGFEQLGRVEIRHAGPWHVMFNPLRALRPPRISGQRFDGLLRSFEPAGFHFNKPFLAREVLWEGDLGGKATRLLYNKFPFARLHGLLVPEPLRELPQYLTPELHDWAWEVCAQSSVPGLCLGYNSTGAGASVNHLHFQSFVLTERLPVQNPRFLHNGGVELYPLPCRHHTDARTAWFDIDRLHQTSVPYNLVYTRDGLYLIPRVPQDSVQLDTASRSYGWSEMVGGVTLFSRDAWEALEAPAFEEMLARFAP